MRNRFLAETYRRQTTNALGSAAKKIGDPELINLSIGDPDFVTPQEIIDEAFIQAGIPNTPSLRGIRSWLRRSGGF